MVIISPKKCHTVLKGGYKGGLGAKLRGLNAMLEKSWESSAWNGPIFGSEGAPPTPITHHLINVTRL